MLRVSLVLICKLTAEHQYTFRTQISKLFGGKHSKFVWLKTIVCSHKSQSRLVVMIPYLVWLTTIVGLRWVEHELNAYNSRSRHGLPTKLRGSPGIYDAWKILKAQDLQPPVTKIASALCTHLRGPQVCSVYTCTSARTMYIMNTTLYIVLNSTQMNYKQVWARQNNCRYMYVYVTIFCFQEAFFVLILVWSLGLTKARPV